MGTAFRTDGVVARLSPSIGASLAMGPGQRGRDAGSGILFAAGLGMHTQDLFAAFWRDELPGMDWLRDFRCDREIDDMLFRLTNPDEEDEEAEILYSKSQLATVGSDVVDVF